MPRLFIAIDLPEPQRRTLEALRDYSLQARWTPPEQYHLTLRFIGDVEDPACLDIQQALRGVRCQCFLLDGEGVGVFPSIRRARVLFARVAMSNDLETLYGNIESCLLEAGVPTETRPFQPHITVARLKDCTPEEVNAYLSANQNTTIEPFLVQHVHLYASELTRKGAIHERLQTYRLR